VYSVEMKLSYRIKIDSSLSVKNDSLVVLEKMIRSVKGVVVLGKD